MKKKLFCTLLLFFLLIIYLYVASITLFPNNIILMQGEKLNLTTLWGINVKQESDSPNIEEYKIGSILQTSSDIGESEVGNTKLCFNLFGNICLKEVSVDIVPKTTVVPLGNSVGLKLYTEGVLVVGMSEIEGEKPYEKLDIKEGDRIISVNDEKIDSTEDLINTVNLAKGEEINIKYIRKGETFEANIQPVKASDDKYKLGLWVRDAAAGVGTATFYVTEIQSFAALGHGITDADTGDLITISNGELVTTNIVSIKKGNKGKPGEMKGSIEGGNKLGDISKNTSFGVFGKIVNKNLMTMDSGEMEVANRNEIKTGKAQIICELDTGRREYYDIDIEKIYTNNNKDNKSMYIKITDERLLEKTGGIVQGMSGSPIIQDGKFIGAVTHVLVNDPTSGYGVFADMMLKQILN